MHGHVHAHVDTYAYANVYTHVYTHVCIHDHLMIASCCLAMFSLVPCRLFSIGQYSLNGFRDESHQPAITAPPLRPELRACLRACPHFLHGHGRCRSEKAVVLSQAFSRRILDRPKSQGQPPLQPQLQANPGSLRHRVAASRPNRGRPHHSQVTYFSGNNLLATDYKNKLFATWQQPTAA